MALLRGHRSSTSSVAWAIDPQTSHATGGRESEGRAKGIVMNMVVLANHRLECRQLRITRVVMSQGLDGPYRNKFLEFLKM